LPSRPNAELAAVHPTRQCPQGLHRSNQDFPEAVVTVVNILFILWVIVFAFWLVRQFSDYNDRTDK
jgi:hypothetical protein